MPRWLYRVQHVLVGLVIICTLTCIRWSFQPSAIVPGRSLEDGTSQELLMLDLSHAIPGRHRHHQEQRQRQEEQEKGEEQQHSSKLSINTTLPLRPPFRIIQIGQPRSGSTFQYQLLTTIASLKASPGDAVNFTFFDWYHASKSKYLQRLLDSGQSFVVKSHKWTSNLDRAKKVGMYPSFPLVVASPTLTGRCTRNPAVNSTTACPARLKGTNQYSA